MEELGRIIMMMVVTVIIMIIMTVKLLEHFP